MGAGAVREGAGHICMGTSAWLAVVTAKRPKGKHGVAAIHSADPDKAFLIAESETAGGCLEWAARNLYSGDASAPDVLAAIDDIVEKTPSGSHGLIFTPWMHGERAPIADCNARSTFLNLSGQHTREDMLRAVYEGVAYNIRWLVEIIGSDFGFPLPKLRVIGGGAKSTTWMQMLADVTGRRIETVADPKEAGAVGAALVAAVGLGIYPNFEALESITRVERTIEPRRENFKTYDELYACFRESYGRLRPLYRKMSETSGSAGLNEEVSP
ncbi:MAG: FGGY-family carbohydrate kinase [Dehalococcoidia bacterium]|nr:FGGY-family carbohydrate kinase [Dehalococcoidia bacterium]